MLLKELHMDPRFASIMRKFREHTTVPRWRKGKEGQTEAWINRSGFVEGVEFVLHSMGYDHEQ